MEKTTSPDGTVTYRTIRITTFACWPATQTMDKQLASIGRTLDAGTTGHEQQNITSNLVAVLEQLRQALGKGKEQ
jgi:hypothetical protein